jgi:hypothetical protein
MPNKSVGEIVSGIVNVRDLAYGAKGDGTTDDTTAIQSALDAAFGTAASPNGINYYANKVLYFPPGQYKTTSPLVMTRVLGGKVFGAGRLITTISNTTGGTVFATNSAAYCQFEGIQLQASGDAVVFDLNADGQNGRTSLQSNSFRDMHFSDGAKGVQIGAGGFMGSENIFQNCYFQRHSVAGLITANANALQQTVIGGNFSGCGNAIWMASGSVPVIHGVGFQQSTGYDIRSDYSAYDAISIKGCRSESINFAYLSAGMAFHIAGVSHIGPSAGDFVANIGCPATVSCCTSLNGRVYAQYAAQMSISECSFGRTDWISLPNGLLWWIPNNRMITNIELSNIDYGWTATPNAHQFVSRQRIVSDTSGNPLTQSYTVA